MERLKPTSPLPPFLEFSVAEGAAMSMRQPWQRRIPPSFEVDSAHETVAYVFDEPGHIYQEPPELEEFGPDQVFDSRGRLAELGVEDFVVVIKRWSEQPDMDLFDRYLRAAAPCYLPEDEVRALGTLDLRDRLAVVMRQRQREYRLFWPVEKFARNLWRLVSRRSE
jgi:hypothetical protein